MEELQATIKTRTTLTLLNDASVSVLTQRYADIDGQELQVGDDLRRAFTNTPEGRKAMEEYLTDPKDRAAVLAKWGELPPDEPGPETE